METDPLARRWTTHDGNRPIRQETLFPDWIMVGVPHEDHVTVYASARLSYASLTQVATYFDELERERIVAGELQPEPWTLSARLLGIFTGTGTTYAEAIEDLTRTWRPDDSGSTEERQRRTSRAELLGAVPAPDDGEIIDAELVEDED